jgi:hypothetical protein
MRFPSDGTPKGPLICSTEVTSQTDCTTDFFFGAESIFVWCVFVCVCVCVFLMGLGFELRALHLQRQVLQSLLLWLFWRWALSNYLVELTSNLCPPDLSLTSSPSYLQV